MATGPVGIRPPQADLTQWQQTDGKAHTRLIDSYDAVEGVTKFAALVWDTVGLAWVKMTQPGGGAGGGGAVTVADGADVTQGAKADAVWDGAAASPTIVAIDKAMWAKLEAVRALLAGTLIVGDGGGSLTIDTAQLPAALVGGRLDVNVGASTALDVSDRGARALGKVSSDDGALVSIGTTTDLATANTVIGRLKQLVSLLAAGLPAALVGGRLDQNIGTWLGSAAPTVGQKAMASSLPVALASDQSVLPAISEMRSATLWVTGTAAVNTGVTLTLPAAGAGLFHYITAIEVVKLYSVVGVAAGAGVIITTTNLPGNPAFTTEQNASAAGTAAKVVDFKPCTPIKSSVANTATTIVCPVQLQTIWRVNVTYFTAA